MAWQHPTHICGHDGERYQAYGKNSERERKLAWVQSQPCPECRARAAKEQSEALSLPALVGSDKQIIWATDIRLKAIKQMTAAEMESSNRRVEAGWWIVNRYLW